ncbi:MAG TPA: type II toxin-antitoxin system death-on-curing family toxin [Terrimesophilobacter sp.]|nr:type II toxin-antitoxin system death-on-curing family toxin [Terrimesophilobacter sp.]HRP98890.1 type II toxin-antitoxin system death-on-curing family toxin [Terrimesophilobacter sp.]
MARKSTTVQELAREADLEVESVLVALWAEGIEHVDSGSSRLSDAERRRAQRVLGTVGAHQRKVAYWLDWLGVSRDEFAELLDSIGIGLDPRAKTVPKGAIRRLRVLPPSIQSTKSIEDLEPKHDERVVPAPEFPETSSTPSISYLSVDDVLAIHSALEEDFFLTDDPISPPGVRDLGLLDGAVERHTTRYGDRWKFPTIDLAGAALLHGLVHNHPFHNGNKRTALVSLLVFLDRNGRVMESTQADLFRWMVQVAAHELLDPNLRYVARADNEVLAISHWVSSASRSIRKDERSVPWRTMRNILKEHGCDVIEGKGEKVRITRRVPENSGRGIFRKVREKVLYSFYTNTGDGREVPRSQIKRIREDLRLDREHAIDSEAFYVTQRQPDYFIQEYSRILSRLAKV